MGICDVLPGNEMALFSMAWVDVIQAQCRESKLRTVDGKASVMTPPAVWERKFGSLNSRHQSSGVGEYAALSAAWFEMMFSYLEHTNDQELIEAFKLLYNLKTRRRRLWFARRGYIVGANGRQRPTLPWRYKNRGSKRRANHRIPKQYEREMLAASVRWDRLNADAKLPMAVALLGLSGSIYSRDTRPGWLLFVQRSVKEYRLRRRYRSWHGEGRAAQIPEAPRKTLGPDSPGLLLAGVESIGEFTVKLVLAVFNAFAGGALWLWISNGFKFNRKDNI